MKADFIDAFLDSGRIDIRESSDRWVVYWNDGGDVYVTPFPDTTDAGHSLGFNNSGFDAWGYVRDLPPAERARYAARLFDEVILSGCDPSRAVREFMKIPEYKDFMDSFYRAFFGRQTKH